LSKVSIPSKELEQVARKAFKASRRLVQGGQALLADVKAAKKK